MPSITITEEDQSTGVLLSSIEAARQYEEDQEDYVYIGEWLREGKNET